MTLFVLDLVSCCDLDTALQVRVAAAESLPFLLDCAKIRGPEYLTQMWQFIYPELIKATETEPESDIKSALMHALAQVSCLYKWSAGLVFEAGVKTLISPCRSQIVY